MRWEMRPRLFLRTAEFLWQEGHTAHETNDEALEETDKMLGIYATFMREHLALPVITGRKSENERFPGAEDTLCVEAMVQDRKAIQAGTSHFLGQNFAKASNITFQGRGGRCRTRLDHQLGRLHAHMIGTVIMAHADDDGSRLATAHCSHPHRHSASHSERTASRGLSSLLPMTSRPSLERFVSTTIVLTVKVDDRDLNGGVKNWEWIKKGVPIRVEIGPRDLEKGSVAVVRRDRGPKDKAFLPTDDFVDQALSTLQEIQDGRL